jgi:glutamate carboxypeptidase
MNAAIGSFLRSSEQQMFALLEELVLIQSSTFNKKGVDQVGDCIESFLADLPFCCERFPQKQTGDHLVFSTPAAKRMQKHILLAGHMDTVFPENTDFNWYREDAEKVYGPGVIDMKGGLVLSMFASCALAHVGILENIPLVLLFNSDEETGSATSVELVEQLAGHACCGLVTECGGIEGQVVTGRKGKTGYHLEVRGRAGHAAFAGSNKASAILELCRLVPELENLNDPGQGHVLNVGRIEGGIGANTVAEYASAEIDTRYGSVAAGKILQQNIQRCVASQGIAGTEKQLVVANRRPVMEQTTANQQLYGIIKNKADALKISLKEEFRQGVSDGSNIAGQGVPVVDGLGPLGEHDHSNREYMIKSSMVARCQLLAESLPEINNYYFS